MRTYYKLYLRGRYSAKTKSIRVAKELQTMGWQYQTVTKRGG